MVDVGLAVPVPKCHVLELFRIFGLLAYLRIILIPEIERSEAAIAVRHSFFEFWDYCFFDELVVLKGIFFKT